MTPTPAQHENPSPPNLGKAFDLYARDYDQFYQADAADVRSFDYRNRRQIALRLADDLLPPRASLLEFGCGAGHTAVELARRGYKMVCVDISEQMVSATQRTMSEAQQPAEVRLGTVADVPLECGPFDGVLAMGVMDYIAQPPETLARVVELLKPGGICLLSFTNAATPVRWIELPLKRAAALGLYAATRDARYRDIAFPMSHAHTRRQVCAWYAQAGLTCESFEYFGFGLRFGSRSIPPLSWVQRWNAALGQSRVRALGRGFVAVGRKPVEPAGPEASSKRD
jgi:cyclopropane fatty-acyl-phospholipid synthase-like methyltransferase